MRGAPIAAALAIAIVAFAATSAQTLLDSPAPGSFDVEPPVLPGNLTADQAPDYASPSGITQLERKLGRAKQMAEDADHLFRIGVLAKVEAENRALRVVKLETELAEARVAVAEMELERKRQQLKNTEIGQAEIDAGESQLKQAKTAAEMAVACQRKAEINAASINLARQQKLLALGSARKSSVQRAEQKLAELKRASQ